MTREQPVPRKKFWERLFAIHAADDRAALARLRRAVADPAGDYNVFATVGTSLPPDLRDWEIDMYLLVACLFAVHPTKGNGDSFGSSLRRLRAMMNVGQESLDQRFAALLNSDNEDVPIRLRHLIQLLASPRYNVVVDYPRLLDNLLNWNSEERRTQRQWARDYWRSDVDENPENEGAQDDTSEPEKSATDLPEIPHI